MKFERTTVGMSLVTAVKYGFGIDWYIVDIVVGLAVLIVPKSEVLVALSPLGEVVVEIIKCRRMSLWEVEHVEFPSAKI